MQRNLHLIIEQLALREQQQDLGAFLRRESEIPGLVSVGERDNKKKGEWNAAYEATKGDKDDV